MTTGERPRGITFSKDFSRLYICASDSNTVQVMDPNTGEILHELPSGEDPEQFVLAPDDRHLYIANETDEVTTVVDTESRKVVAQTNVGIEPEGMAVSPDGKIAITTSETTNMAHWINTEAHELFANTLVDSRPRHAEFTADGAQLWLTAEIGGTVSVFETKGQTQLAKVDFAISGVSDDLMQPVGLRFSPDGKRAFVALGPSNHVAVVDTATYQVTNYILVGRRVWHLEFSPDQSLLFTTNGVSGDVTVIDVASENSGEHQVILQTEESNGLLVQITSMRHHMRDGLLTIGLRMMRTRSSASLPRLVTLFHRRPGTVAMNQDERRSAPLVRFDNTRLSANGLSP